MNALHDARVHAHHAVQLAAAPGTTLLPAREDHGHECLAWSESVGGFVGQDVEGRSAALRVADLTLVVDGEELPLAGRTRAEGLRWLSDRFGAEVATPTHELPPSPLARDAPFELSPALAELATLYSRAAVALASLGPEVRVWPHHFDIAVLLDLGGGRSVGVGLSPGDGSYPDPYWYVTPWPYPEDRTALPVLDAGAWHVDGWVGAVLPGSEGPGAFLPSAVAACRRILEG